jgi:hypothetical protein
VGVVAGAKVACVAVWKEKVTEHGIQVHRVAFILHHVHHLDQKTWCFGI